MVGGRWVLREGRITGVDEAAVLAEAREVGPQVMARYAEGERVGEALLPAVRRGWLEALKADVGVSRSVPLD
jgi:hypothetical protein